MPGIAIGVALGVFFLGAGLWAARDRLVRRRLRQKVVVTLKSGEAFKGVLRDVDARTFLLVGAEQAVRGNGQLVPVDGELIISREDIDYMQRP